jgi:hypothetical protein
MEISQLETNSRHLLDCSDLNICTLNKNIYLSLNMYFNFKVAPPGLTEVQTMACGACSIEHGQKAMFIAYQVELITL